MDLGFQDVRRLPIPAPSGHPVPSGEFSSILVAPRNFGARTSDIMLRTGMIAMPGRTINTPAVMKRRSLETRKSQLRDRALFSAGIDPKALIRFHSQFTRSQDSR
jgi:hypothetical protein